MTSGCEPRPRPLRIGWLRWMGLGLVVTDAALVGGLAADGSVLAQPGGSGYVIAVLVALVIYAGG